MATFALTVLQKNLSGPSHVTVSSIHSIVFGETCDKDTLPEALTNTVSQRPPPGHYNIKNIPTKIPSVLFIFSS